MFGFDDDALTAHRARRHRRLRWWVVLLELLVVGSLATPVLVLDLVYRPGGLQPLLDRAMQNAPARLLIDDVVMLPVGSWFELDSLRLAVEGMSFVPRDPKKPDWSIGRGELPLPDLARGTDGRWVIHWTRLDIWQLRITAHQQRPPPPWEPTRGPVLKADRAFVHGASYRAEEDAPLKEAAVSGIVGDLHDIVYDTGRREVSGAGTLRATRFRTGSIDLTDLVVPDLTLDRSTMHFRGTGDLVGSLVTLSGTIGTFHIKPSVEVEAHLRGTRLADVVRMATGEPSPVYGRLDLDLVVRAGGSLPRGGAIISGDVVIREGKVQLPRSTRYVVLDVLRLLPWVDLDLERRVLLDTMQGHIVFTRGTVTVQEVTYPAGKRQLRMDGTIGKGRLYIAVRLLPLSDPDHKPGLGVVLYGTPRDQRFRLAAREDLLKKEPWLPFESDAERRATTERLERDRLIRRELSRLR